MMTDLRGGTVPSLSVNTDYCNVESDQIILNQYKSLNSTERFIFLRESISISVCQTSKLIKYVIYLPRRSLFIVSLFISTSEALFDGDPSTAL